ncbi:MAG: VWA domain-containing protein, partial [Chloroflexi bacterium]|nr:VWA domain-containing protein [Chloroflexota bacterium]
LIWLNPLLGMPSYQPLTQGIQAALPYVDDFLPVHNLDSLEALGRHLERIEGRRPTRRQRAGYRTDLIADSRREPARIHANGRQSMEISAALNAAASTRQAERRW